MLDSFPKY